MGQVDALDRLTSLVDLHDALRTKDHSEAHRIALILQAEYKSKGYPKALQSFVDKVVSGAAVEPVSPESEGLTPGFLWKPSSKASIKHLNAALAIWNGLMPAHARIRLNSAKYNDNEAELALNQFDPILLESIIVTSSKNFSWLDGWYCDSHRLRLRLAPQKQNSSLHWEAFQWHPRCRELCSCGSLELGAKLEQIIEIPLHDALAPLLLCAGDGDGGKGVAELLVLPFPSLLRHGLHHGELVAAHERQAVPKAVTAFSLSCLRRLQEEQVPRVVSWTTRLPSGMSGGLSGQVDLTDWLEWMRLLRLRKSQKATALQLRIDGDGIPSLRALTGLKPLSDPGTSNKNQGEPPFVVLDPVDLRPRLHIRPGRSPLGWQANTSGEDVLGGAVRLLLQGEKGPEPAQTSEVVALLRAPGHEPRRTPLWLPAVPAEAPNPDSLAGGGAIHVVLHGLHDPDDLEFTLWSLDQQRGIALRSLRPLTIGSAEREVLMTVQPMIEAMRQKPELLPFSSEPSLESLLRRELAPGELLCLLRAGVCLQNPDTLLHLRQLLQPPEVASAGCLLIHERVRGRVRTLTATSCGLVPGALELSRADELELHQQTLLEALGPQQLSVLANSPDLALINPGAPCWQLAELRTSSSEVLPSLEQQWLDASLAAVLAGGLHRASSELSAMYRTAPKPDRRFRARLAGANTSLLGVLPELLAASTCVDVLKP